MIPDYPELIVNAILPSMLNRAAYLLASSRLSTASIDGLIIGVCGHEIGLLVTLDLIGLDVALKNCKNLHTEDPEINLLPAPITQELVNEENLERNQDKASIVIGSNE